VRAADLFGVPRQLTQAGWRYSLPHPHHWRRQSRNLTSLGGLEGRERRALAQLHGRHGGAALAGIALLDPQWRHGWSSSELADTMSSAARPTWPLGDFRHACSEAVLFDQGAQLRACGPLREAVAAGFSGTLRVDLKGAWAPRNGRCSNVHNPLNNRNQAPASVSSTSAAVFRAVARRVRETR